MHGESSISDDMMMASLGMGHCLMFACFVSSFAGVLGRARECPYSLKW